MRLTDEEYERLTGQKAPEPTSTLLQFENRGSQSERTQKYAAVPTEADGIRFASKKEARRYEYLRDRQLAGEISGLEWQKSYRLELGGVLLCRYIADFVYQEQGEQRVEDVKGARDFRSPVFRLFLLKKRLMLALYGIEVKEI